MARPGAGVIAVNLFSLPRLSAPSIPDFRRSLVELARDWAGLLVAIPLALIVGLVIGTGSIKLVAIVATLLIAVASLFISLQWVVWLTIGLTFLIVGPINYFFGIGALRWVPFLAGLLLYVRVLLHLLKPQPARPPFPAFLWALFFYLSVFFLTTVINQPPIYPLFLAARNYLFLWGLFFALAFVSFPESLFPKIWRALIGVAMIQFPFAVYQYFVVAANRIDSTRWDAVIGTFFGEQSGGGDSGGMALFLVMIVTTAVALWRRKVFGTGALVVLILLATGTILLAEVKVVLLLIPLAFITLYRSDIVRRPLESLVIGTLVFAALAAVVLVYKQIHMSSAEGGRNITLEKQLEVMTKFSFATTAIAPSGEMGRGAALAFWWSKSSLADDPLRVLLGYGPGASRGGDIYDTGVAAKRFYPYNIDASAATVLLWELGVVGFIGFIAVLVLGIHAARRLRRSPNIPLIHVALLEASVPALVLNLATVPYNTNAVASASAQILVALLLGHIAYWHLRVGSQRVIAKSV